MTSEQPAPKPRTPITDSPWFWGYVFAAAGLAALAIAAPKYQSRQTQLERRFLARQEGGQTIKGDDGHSIATPNGDNLILRLGPLFLIVGSLLVVAWSRFWWTRLAPPTAETIADPLPSAALKHDTKRVAKIPPNHDQTSE